MASQWHYQLFGEEFGPVSEDVLRGLLEKGILAADDSVRCDGGRWVAVSEALAQDSAESNTATAVLNADDTDEADDWYCQVLGQELGPLSFNDLLRFAETGELSANDQIRFGAEGKWRRVGSMGRLVAVLPYQAVSQPVKRNARPAAPPAPVTVAAPPAAATSTPPVQPAAKPSSLSGIVEANELNWFAWIRGVEYGPSSLLQLQQALASGQLGASDFVKMGPTGAWFPSSTVNDILKELERTSAPAPAPVARTPVAVAPPVVAKVSAPAVQNTPTVAPTKSVTVPEMRAVTPPVEEVQPPPPAPKPEPKAPPTTSTNSSYSSSTYGGSSTKSWQPPAAKSYPKPAARSRGSSGGGMSFDFSALTGMFDAKTLGIGGGLIGAAALVFAFMYMPGGNGAEVSAFKELHALYTEFQKVRESKGGDAQVQAISTKVQQVCPPLAASLEKRASAARPATQKLYWIAKYRMNEMIAKGAATRSGAEIECERMLFEASKILNVPMDEPKPVETTASKNAPKTLDVGT